MNGSLCGYVVQDQRPIPGATIMVIESPGPHIDMALVSDAEGSFTMTDLSPGIWRFQANTPYGSQGRAEVRIWEDSLSEVTISVDTSTRHQNDDERNTNSFVRENPEPNDQRSMDVREGRRPTFGSLYGRVIDAITGRPVSDAIVVITDGPGPLPDALVHTDAAGGFSIPSLGPGDWKIQVAADQGNVDQVAILRGNRVNVVVALVQAPVSAS